jgi:hypothetical protein
MKKVVLSLICAGLLFAAHNVSAQAPEAYKLTFEGGSNPPAYALPYTTVKVRLTIEKESVVSGPYARFAQKFLGAMAPLTNKETYAITSAEMDYTTPTHTITEKQRALHADKSVAMSHVYDKTSFPKATPDRMSMVDKSSEDMARDAANTIYTIRKRRFDLISGEAGENVFGAGLEDAIKAMNDMENAYLELFLGKRIVTTMVREFNVVPERGETNCVICRFSDTLGILPDSDLSGRPVALMLTPERRVVAGVQKSDKRAVEYYAVPDYAVCRVMDDNRELATERLPIYQLGTVVAAQK